MLSALLVTRWRLGVVDYVCDDSRVWTRRAFACFLAGLAAVSETNASTSDTNGLRWLALFTLVSATLGWLALVDTRPDSTPLKKISPRLLYGYEWTHGL